MLTLGKKALSVPILQGGMGVGVSLGGLAGAVAACGGMGCISTAAGAGGGGGVPPPRRCGLPGAGFCPRPGKRQPPRPDR